MTVLLLGLILLVLSVGVGIAVVGREGGHDACTGKSGRSISVDIRDSVPSVSTLHADLCDKLTFTNQDKATREIGFGNHDNHVPYDGISERILDEATSFTITLNQTGTFYWHDHLHDEVDGYFTVTD